MSPPSFRAREKKCGFITHAGQNIMCVFVLFSSQKQPVRDTPGDMWSPETWVYNQTQEPGTLTQLLLPLTAAVSQSLTVMVFPFFFNMHTLKESVSLFLKTPSLFRQTSLDQL